MDLLSHPETSTSLLEEPSIGFLLQRGIDCTKQGAFLEGAAYFARARERLTPDQTHITALLDAFLQNHVTYKQTQEAFHLAARRFADIDAEQQTRLFLLEKLVLTLDEAMQGRSAELERARLPVPFSPQTATEPANKLLSPPSSPALSQSGNTLPALSFTCFGKFEVRCQGKPIVLCSSRSGQAILRYLITQSNYSATSDILMALLWSEEELGVARNKLHIAISALRRSLNSGSKSEQICRYILCENRRYYLNPTVEIRTDVDEFLDYYRRAQYKDEATVSLCERACNLYRGPFLSEDIYADWSSIQREQLSQIYISMCRMLTDHYLKSKHYDEAVKWAMTMLRENRCDELAHRKLMYIYAAKGARAEAIKQFQRCEHILRDELAVCPMPETTDLLQKILAGDIERMDASLVPYTSSRPTTEV